MASIVLDADLLIYSKHLLERVRQAERNLSHMKGIQENADEGETFKMSNLQSAITIEMEHCKSLLLKARERYIDIPFLKEELLSAREHLQGMKKEGDNKSAWSSDKNIEKILVVIRNLLILVTKYDQ